MIPDSPRDFPRPTAQDYRDIANALRMLVDPLLKTGGLTEEALHIALDLVLPGPPGEEGVLFRVAGWHAENPFAEREGDALDRGRIKSALRAVQGLCADPPEIVGGTVLASMAWEFWFLGGGN